MRTAFKEWAAICRALVKGRQDVILRKGGIVEDGGEFRPDHASFLLLPTFLHQSPDSLIPEARDLLVGIDDDRPPEGRVVFRHEARVVDARRVTRFEDLAAYRSRHVWSDAVVAERFHRWKDELHVLEVEVTPLPSPVTLPWHESYGGCRSWVELHDASSDVTRSGGMAEPVESTLERHRAGDPQAVAMLMEYVESKIAAKVAKLLPIYPGVARWDRPSDIRQDVAIELLDSLAAVKPKSVRHLLNLAAVQVRRVLVDRAREHARVGRGLGNLEDVALWPDGRNPAEDASRRMTGPGTLDQWERFHACVDSLTDLDREVFSMRWYLEEDEETIAKALGVSRSTVQRAYREAKKVIQEKLGRPTRD